MSVLPASFHDAGQNPVAVLRILLAEDDRMAALMLEEQLGAAGHIVETAQNGAQAYAMLREDAARCDVLLTDRFMPVLDGLGLTRRILREAPTRHLPVVMLTGAGDAASIAEGLEAGVMQYLAKPVDPGLLAQVLASVRRRIDERARIASSLAAHRSAFADVQRLDLTLRRHDQIGPAASLLASLSPQSERILPALHALIVNGVEHGLYRLGGEVRRWHQTRGTLAAELARREADAAYPGQVEVAVKRIARGLRFAVRDPGPGFAWRRYVRPDAALGNVSGPRGLLRAQLVFDEVHFHGEGNLVTAIHRDTVADLW